MKQESRPLTHVPKHRTRRTYRTREEVERGRVYGRTGLQGDRIESSRETKIPVIYVAPSPQSVHHSQGPTNDRAVGARAYDCH